MNKPTKWIMRTKDIKMDIGDTMGRLLTAPKQVFYGSLRQIWLLILLYILIDLWLGRLTYLQLIPPIIAIISILIFASHFYKHYIKREWEIAITLCRHGHQTLWLSHDALMKEIFVNEYLICSLLIIGAFVVACELQHLAICHILWYWLFCLSTECCNDNIFWRITIGNRIDVDTAKKLKYIMFSKYDEMRYFIGSEFDEYGVPEIRHYFSDGLMSGKANISFVRDLLEIFPGYLHLPNRCGFVTPFQLACLDCSVDIVQYMAELDDSLIKMYDKRGYTPLHFACQNTTSGSLEVVNYLLEKQMSLVTKPNKNGDLPIHLASDKMKEGYVPVKTSSASWRTKKRRYEAERIEIVWRLFLAYPDCLDCVRAQRTISSNKTVQKRIKKKKRWYQ